MKKMSRSGSVLLLLLALCPMVPAAQATELAPPALQMLPAEHFSSAASAPILAVTRAAKRLVAVGDHGVVLLSDDDGKTYRQAKTVPVRSTLNSVVFVDARTGWAAGHWGVILKTSDAGETWVLQRSDQTVDQPLFSVYFSSQQDGWAVGLWSLMLHTTDGGLSWTVVPLPAPPEAKKADASLYAIFADARHSLYVACEQGRVMRSTDGGQNWTYIRTGYAGSFWTGVALQDGVLLVGGLRGTIYRSADGGTSWQAALTPLKSSVTQLIQQSGQTVLAAGLDGMLLESHDGGVSFTGKQRSDRRALTTVVESEDGVAHWFSTSGPVLE